MLVTFTIGDNDRRACGLIDDINAFLHLYTRAEWTMREQDVEVDLDEDEPGVAERTLLTIDFRDPLDAVDLMGWRSLHHRGRRS